jgi:hypothetical protein
MEIKQGDDTGHQRSQPVPANRGEQAVTDGWESVQSATLLVGALTFALFLTSLTTSPWSIDHRVFEFFLDLNPASAAGVFAFLDTATGLVAAMAAWAFVLAASAVARRWGAAVAVASIPFAFAAAFIIERMVSTGVSSVLRLPGELSLTQLPAYPGGQIIGAVLIYGSIFMFARSFQRRHVRLPLQAASIFMIVAVGVTQLWMSALWPTEIAAAYLISGLMLGPLSLIVRRIDLACAELPLVRAAEVPIDDETPHARALTSTVVFNGPTVSKIYRPGFIPRAIYWVAFQAEFPYMRNESALRAAVARRNLIGKLTEFWYESNLVARAIGIDTVNGRYAITSEFIDGEEPRDRAKAREFLSGLVEHFEEAGLPTWQIDPRQPRATDNVIETSDGRFHVVDLESGLVAPLASIQTWKRAFRRGMVPLYDDVFFDVTRAYIARNENAMREKFGQDWVNTLYSTLEVAETETREWHDSEPRIWSRLLGRRRQVDRSESRRHWAIQWFEQAIDGWREDGRISSREAADLRAKVRSPRFISVMPHFGVHLGTGLLLRFPLGSIARVAYTIFHLAAATWRLARRRVDRAEWREQAGIHSPIVILFAAIPGFGAFAYLASKPFRSDHLLLRIGLDAVMMKFPWRLYERTRARWFITDLPDLVLSTLASSDQKLRTMHRYAWSEEHRSTTVPENDPRVVSDVSAAARLIV